jgi:protein ImuB
MTRLEVETIGRLKLLPRSLDGEAAARTVLLECAARFSPRIEEASHDTACTFALDITGTERLFGPPERLASRLRAALLDAGFRASIAVSANFHTARIKAAATRGITVIPEGEEASALASLPITALHLADRHLETFALWGIQTLRELAALPEVELVTRLGAEVRTDRDLARGVAAHTFQPVEPAFSLVEFFEFDAPVEQMESLLFIGARMIDCLVARAAGHALSLASLDLLMKLEGGRTHVGTIRPALPSIDRRFLLKLLQLEIGAHPPPAAVVSLALTAVAGQSSNVQLGLFAPQTPEPSRLDVTLARLKAIVGDDHVGSPVLDDTHRAGSFHMKGFSVDAKASAPMVVRAHMALRRIRPPVPVRVAMRAMKPAAFRDEESRFEISAAYGPWRTSGCWWSTDGWDAEEWDVLAAKSTGEHVACLLAHDRTRNEWRLEAFYD